jgi:hypothetical protein
MGPTLRSTSGIFTKQNYENWIDCREDQSKIWCKKIFQKYDSDNRNGVNKGSQVIGQLQSSSSIVYLQETLPLRHSILNRIRKKSPVGSLKRI